MLPRCQTPLVLGTLGPIAQRVLRSPPSLSTACVLSSPCPSPLIPCQSPPGPLLGTASRAPPSGLRIPSNRGVLRCQSPHILSSLPSFNKCARYCSRYLEPGGGGRYQDRRDFKRPWATSVSPSPGVSRAVGRAYILTLAFGACGYPTTLAAPGFPSPASELRCGPADPSAPSVQHSRPGPWAGACSWLSPQLCASACSSHKLGAPKPVLIQWDGGTENRKRPFAGLSSECPNSTFPSHP